MEVVRLCADDYDRIVALWGEAGLPFRPLGRDSRAAFARQLDSGVQAAFGVEQDGRLVGVVTVSHDSRKGWINRLAAAPDLRRQGVATRLIRTAEAYLQGQGIELYAALILEGNQASIAAFEAAGYTHAAPVLYFSKRPDPDV